MCTTSRSAVVSSVNPGRSEVRLVNPREERSLACMIVGSGSTYVYGYCDATYQDGWGKDETIEFVKNSKPPPHRAVLPSLTRPQLWPLPCPATARLAVSSACA